MSDYTIAEVTEVFKKAANMNAAVKKVLKQDIQDEAALKFIKSFRTVLGADRDGALEGFLEKYLDKYDKVLLALAVVAHKDLVTEIVNVVIEKYADEFNTTYEKKEGGVTYKDRTKFEKVVKEVRGVIEAHLQAAELPASHFLKAAVITQIFDEELLPEVTPLVIQ